MKYYKAHLLLQQNRGTNESIMNALVMIGPNEKATLRVEGGKYPDQATLPGDIKPGARVFYIDVIKGGTDPNYGPRFFQSSLITPDVANGEKHVQVFVIAPGGNPDNGGVGNYDDPDGYD